MSRFALDGCTALITGASAGIGREFAKQLATRASGLVLVARREDRLTDLANELKSRYPKLNIVAHATDLSRLEQVHELCDFLEREKVSVDLLVNNAGLGDYGGFASSDVRRDEDIVAVNVTALTLLTRRLLPPMIARHSGGILNVSSSAGFLPIADMSLYAATKAFVTSFSEGLRMELRESGLHVTALCPGPVHTEFNTVARRPGAGALAAPAFTRVSTRHAVRAGLRGIERNQPTVIPGLVMKLGMTIVRLTPMPLLRFAARFRQRV